MKHKHSPGPWKPVVLERQGFHQYPLGYKTIIDLDDTFSSENQGQASSVAATLIVFGPQGEANAQLMAMAPDLLVAVEQLLSIITSPMPIPNSTGQPILDNAKKLLAKAKGE